MGLFIVLVSVLYNLFFFTPKSPEKAANECCLIENPRHFFNLVCKSVFNKFCPVHKFCVWDFVDSVPKFEIVNNFKIFHPKLQYHTFYFFVLDVNQLTFAKMNNFSLLQIIERIPELRFKYMQSYPSDKVPQLTKYSFAIVISAPSNGRGGHWIMMARLDKTYYFAASLGRKRTTYSFLTKKYRRMVPRKLRKTDNLYGFYAI